MSFDDKIPVENQGYFLFFPNLFLLTPYTSTPYCLSSFSPSFKIQGVQNNHTNNLF
ncbi:hypothetical protein ACRRTK_010828 [Alexandromys fortis]